MDLAIPRRVAAIIFSTTFLAAGWASSARADFTPILYQTFAQGQVDAIDLNTRIFTSLSQSATNIAAGGGMVFFQNDTLLYQAGPTLGGVSTFHRDGFAPSGLALDASTGLLYQSFSQGQIDAIDLKTTIFHSISQSASNIAAGDGKVFFQSGSTIYAADSLLTSVHVFHVNASAPTGLALDASTGLLYETFGSGGIVALNTFTGATVASLNENATAIAAGDGRVFFTDNNFIRTANSLLADVTTFHIDGFTPAGLALAPARVNLVPEPSTMIMALSALLCVVGSRRLRPAGRPDQGRTTSETA